MSLYTIRTRAVHEVRQFAAIAAYLFVCFGAVILLKRAVQHGQGVDMLPWGFAVVKAAITAKFMMLGHALRLGERHTAQPLIWPTLERAVVFVVLLAVLTVIEEVLSGLIHGRTALQSVMVMGGGTLFEAGATLLVTLLILIPYFAFRTLGEVMGEGRLVRLFFVERGPTMVALPHQPE